jgi:3-dehydroquinate synthetase
VSRLEPAQILAAMKSDKKTRDGKVRFILVEAPGSWRATHVSDEVLLAELGRWLGELEGES